MSLIETQDAPPVAVTPNLLAGMVSPLWSYYAAMTTAGLAFWGLARLSRPVNLEAAFEAVAPVPEADPVELPPEATPLVSEPPVEMLAMAAPEIIEPPVEMLADVPSEIVAPLLETVAEARVEAVAEVAPVHRAQCS